MAPKIQGWTPKTDNLLRYNPSGQSTYKNNNVDVGSSPLLSSDQCHYGGYDIIDGAFGHTFPSKLLNELQINGWIDDPVRGIKGKLEPARTTMDVQINNLLHSFVNNPFMDISKNDDDDASSPKNSIGMRGDKSAFISRQERMEGTFPSRCPLLQRLVSSIESTAHNRLGKSTTTNTTYFEFDTSLTSVQIAKYPGDGESGYPRHCDRGAKCLQESNNTKKDSAERLLTFVYYLTPTEWDDTLDGGALRMFSPLEQSIDNHGNTDVSYFDVTPYSDRLVVFRSDLIEHQVMPSLRRDRIAITVWLYGKVAHQRKPENGSERFMLKDEAIVNKPSICAENERDKTTLPPPLPLDGRDLGSNTIFVAIPSYRDEETWPTIKSLIDTACYSERVYVGVVFQVDTTSQDEVRHFTTLEGSGISIESAHWKHHTNLRTITMDCRHATGPCYARFLAQTLHRGEHYVLQIDSHMRFRPNWDEYLIQQLNKTNNPTNSVLTAYPPGYEIQNEPGIDAETRGTMLVPWKFSQEDGMLRQKGRLLRRDYSEDENIPCHLYAGGFNFCQSSILDICPYDSKLHGLFFGEEISMAVRLFTHGIDLYSPPQAVCYHLWKRNTLRVREDSNNEKLKLREQSLEVVHTQLRGLGRGIGTVRSAEQFAVKLGIDFEKQTLVPGCENVGLCADAFMSSTSLISAEDVKVGAASSSLSDNNMSSVFKLVDQFMKEK